MPEMSHKYHSVEDISDSITSKHSQPEESNKRTPIIDAMNRTSKGKITSDAHKKNAVKENKVIEIHNVKEYEEFKKHARGVVFYGATWCHACKDIETLYARIANRYHKRIAMAHVDIDEANLDFSEVPVFVALRHGTQIDSVEGADKKGLKLLIKNAITCE